MSLSPCLTYFIYRLTYLPLCLTNCIFTSQPDQLYSTCTAWHHHLPLDHFYVPLDVITSTLDLYYVRLDIYIYHSFFNRLKKSWKYGTIIGSTNFFSFIKKCLNPSFLFYSQHFAITDQIVQIQNLKVQHGYSDILGFQSYILTLHFFSFLHFYSL